MERERAALSKSVHGKLLGVLSQERLEALVVREAGSYRQCIYPPLVTLGLFVEQAISHDQACQDAVGRALSQRAALGLTASSLNTGPYCKARQRLPLSLIQSCAREVAACVWLLLPRQLGFAAARRAVATHQELLRHHPAMDGVTTRQALLQRIAYHKLPHRPDRVAS